MIRITRRQAIVGGTATAVIATAGGSWILSADAESFIAGFVRHVLSGEKIAPGATEQFAAEYLGVMDSEDPGKLRALMSLQRVVGFAGLDAALDSQRPYEFFKRRVVTAFMLSSTFFYRSAPEEAVEYVAISGACRNPFARFA